MSMFGREIDHYRGRILWATLGLKFNVRHFSYSREMAIQSFNRYTEEIYDMATKMKKALASKPVKQQEFEWKGFVNVSLTADQKEAYKAWDIHDDDVWDGLAQYCAAGYKINLSFNKQNDKFNCTGTGQPSSGPNNGYAVSAFANTPYEAARVWLFKVSSVLPDIWSEFKSEDVDDIG
jgi:hypothetical protein